MCITVGICKLKEQCDTTTNLLEGQKSETVTVSNPGEDVKL